EAAKWFRRAAEQGHAWAQIELGRCYALGKGIPRDKEMARKWYHAAWENGDGEVQAAAQEALHALNNN
ncbi:MAG: hypothetical protein ACI4SG_03675, partial [Oligosphaeraceae bacterium]